MAGIGVQSDASPASSAAAYGLDMAGRVASATVSGVVGMIGSGGGGLSLHGSTMKLQWSVSHLSFFFSLCFDILDSALTNLTRRTRLLFPSLTFIFSRSNALYLYVKALRRFQDLSTPT
jgi:hypothetical protein